MKQRIEDKQKAIELRKLGLSYQEIMKIISVSKGTLSGWLKYLVLSPTEENHLVNQIKVRQDNGRIRASLSNRKRRIAREKISHDAAHELYVKYKEDKVFIAGILLYWAEGSKRTGEFQFINSDPDMIVFINKWLKKYFEYDQKQIKYRLFIHRNYSHENLEDFWANLLGVERNTFAKTIYKPTSLGIKRNPDYKGCLRISVSSIDSLRKVKYLIELLKRELSLHP